MNARWVQRLVSLVSGIVLALSGIAILLIAINWIPAEWVAVEGVTTASAVTVPDVVAIPWAVVVLLLGVVGVRCALLKRSPGTFIVQKSELGELRIAVKAVDNLVKKCIESHNEIRLTDTRILNTRDGISIMLSISLASNVSIPLAVAALQKQIKQYLMMCSGVDVREVHVAVENADGMVSDSPYVLPDVADAPVETTGKRGKERRTLQHQRIFGRDAQPVVMPPVPGAEAEAEIEAEPEAAIEPVQEQPEETPPAEAAPEQSEAAPDDEPSTATETQA